MANTDNRRGFRPYTCIGGQTGVVPTWEGVLKSYHIAAVGDALYASAGYMRNAATTDKAVLGVMACRGHTTSTSTAASNDDVLFWPAHDNIVFVGQTSGEFAQAKIWTLVDVEGTPGNSTGISSEEVNEDATTNKNVWVIGYDEGSTTNGSVGYWTDVLFTWAKNKFSCRGPVMYTNISTAQYAGY